MIKNISRKFKILKPVKPDLDISESLEDEIEKYILKVFFNPLLKKFKTVKNILQNSSGLEFLKREIKLGNLIVKDNFILGKFSSKLTKIIKEELKGTWIQGKFKIDPKLVKSKLSTTIIAADKIKNLKFKNLEKKLKDLSKIKISKEFTNKIEKILDSNIKKTSSKLNLILSTHKIKISFTAKELLNFKKKYLETTKRPIVQWIHGDVLKLRTQMKALVLTGSRYDDAVTFIKKRKNITLRKARFLARQETNLLTASIIEKSYTSAGVSRYIWRTTPAKGYPRRSHAELEGKIFKFSDPPEVNSQGDRRNPGEDYQCRCWASAIVDF